LSTSVTIDADRCIGSGDCVRLEPAAFRIQDDLGVAVPLEGAAEARIETLVSAARNCPTNAITVVAADGNILVASAE